jgi:hypothetical protein
MAKAIPAIENQPTKNKTGLDLVAEKVGTTVTEQQPRPRFSKGVLKEDYPMTTRRKEFMGDIAMRPD